MKKTTYFISFTGLIMCVLLSSCGPGKKLVASRQHVKMLQIDSTDTHGLLNDCNSKVSDLSNQKTSLQNQNALIANDLKALNSSSKLTIAEQANRLKSLQNMIQSQKDVLNKLKNTISVVSDTFPSMTTQRYLLFFKIAEVSRMFSCFVLVFA